MHAPRGGAEAVVHRDLSTVPREPSATGGTTLERIRARGTLRVGYDPGNPPFSFWNAEGQLVGLDVELAQGLAEALGVKAEFVPVGWGEVPAALADNLVDVMPSVWYRPFWFSSARLSEPYLTGTMGIVVRDERRHEFGTVEAIRHARGLRIGVPLDASQIAVSMKRYFDGADVTFVPLESSVPFFEGRVRDLDGYLMPAESGSAMTLLHPQYAVVVPQPDPVTLPMAFGMALHSEDLATTVNEWIVFATSEGQMRRAYDYWVLGQGAKDDRPRWSILRDVLGWGPGPGRR
jgi:ABC-type amino acid transport substrate-binding protein